MSGPESSSAAVAEPKYTAEQLADPNAHEDLAKDYLDQYKSADRIGLAAMVQNGLREGVFELAPGDKPVHDTHFDTLKIQGRTPEITEQLLQPMRERQLKVMVDEQLAQHHALTDTMSPEDRVKYVEALLKQQVGQEILDVRVPAKTNQKASGRPGTPGKPGGSAAAAPAPAQVGFFQTAESLAAYRVYESLRTDYVTKPEDAEALAAFTAEVASNKSAIITAESKRGYSAERAQKSADRAATEARAKIEQAAAEHEQKVRADKLMKTSYPDVVNQHKQDLKTAPKDEKARMEAEYQAIARTMLDYKENRRDITAETEDDIELAAKWLITSTPDERKARADEIQTKIADRNADYMNFKMLPTVNQKQVLEEAHEEAFAEDKTAAEMAAVDARYKDRLAAAPMLERRAIEQQRVDTIARLRFAQEARQSVPMSDAEYQAAQATAAAEAADAVLSAKRDVVPDKAENPAAYQKAIDLLHEKALNADPDALAQSEAYQRHQRVIDSLGNAINAETRQHLMDRRDRAMAEVKGTQVSRDKTKIDNYSEVIMIREDAVRAAEKHESWNRGIAGVDEHAEAKAQALRQELKLAPMPFLESRSGGLFHLSSKKRGPKIIESYFRSEDPKFGGHLLTVERRMRSSGELISQTTITTEKPIRRRRPRFAKENVLLPPKEVKQTVESIRNRDRIFARDEAKFRDYFSGFRLNDKFDGTSGVYARNLPPATTAAERSDNQKILDNHRMRKLRRGGITYWLSGNRI